MKVEEHLPHLAAVEDDRGDGGAASAATMTEETVELLIGRGCERWRKNDGSHATDGGTAAARRTEEEERRLLLDGRRDDVCWRATDGGGRQGR
ncbi:hypothetical protein SESBI_33741 [Sesbania bispinosa]|nr:hypothetical protein SESBI_33741 [Sesbania bispinosa]